MSQPSNIISSTSPPPEPTREARLLDAIETHFDCEWDLHFESYVLHHDYGWSALDIGQTMIPGRKVVYDICKDESEVEVLMMLGSVEQRLKKFPSRWHKYLDAERVFLFFHFVEFDRTRRAPALAKFADIRAICGDDFFLELGKLLGWTAHEWVELGVEFGQTIKSGPVN